MIAVLSRTESWCLLAFASACVGLLANTFHGDGEALVVSLAFSGLAYSATYALIRWLGPTFIKAGLKGRDMSKPIKKDMYCDGQHDCLRFDSADLGDSPEAMGAVAASIYLLILIAFIPFPFYKDIVAATSGGGNRDVVLQVAEVEMGRFLHRFPHSKVRTTASLTSHLSAKGGSSSASSRHTCPLSSPYIRPPCWESQTTFSIYAGATKCSFPRSLRYRCSWYIMLILE